jgi:NAD(P)-dependent dehydrogenase (short-subunit alcohol dehydrogenase family)
MKGRTGAAVINVASISGWSPQLAMSGQYGAAKAALIFDTERWALEFVPHRVRVNTVSPGFDTSRGQWLGPLPPRQPGPFRGLRPPWLSDGPPRHCPGGCGCDRVPRRTRAYWLNGHNIPVDGLEQPYAALDRRPYQAWARASSRPARTRRQMNASSKPLL